MRRSPAAAVLLAAVLLVAGCGGSGSKPARTGGLVNEFGNTGTQPASGQAVKSALAATAQRPRDPQAWAALVQAYFQSAAQNGASPGHYTAAEKQSLAGAATAFQRYVQLTSRPSGDIAALGARANAGLGNYAAAAKAWQLQTAADPSLPKGWECLAVSAYAAKDNRLGDLALAKAISLVQPPQRALLRQGIPLAKSHPEVAAQC